MSDIRMAAAMAVLALLAAFGSESGAAPANEQAAASAEEAEFSVSKSGVKFNKVPGFGGVIAERYDDSEG